MCNPVAVPAGMADATPNPGGNLYADFTSG
jgi:hypothetical protein